VTTKSYLSFSSGELTPSLAARADLMRFQTGLKTCRNNIVQRHGGVKNRSGTKYVGPTFGKARLIKFIFNNDQTYVLEFTHEKIRFIKNGAYLEDSLVLTITDITLGVNFLGEAEVTYTGTDPADGETFNLSDIDGALGPYFNGRTVRIDTVNTVANTFIISGISTGSYPAYTSGGSATRIYEIDSPYDEDDLALLKITQSADVLTIVHPSYAPRELSRLGETNWTLTTLSTEPSIGPPVSGGVSGTGGSVDYEWKITSVKEETYEESVPCPAIAYSSVTLSTSDPVTLTWSAVTDAVQYNVYRSENGVFGFVGVAEGLSFVDIGYTPDLSDTPPAERTLFASSGNYPSCVAYIQQRLAFANTTNDPEKCWLSRIGFYKNFTISNPIQDDDAVTFTLAGRQVNAVKHLVDVGRLLLFSSSGEWAVGDDSGLITPTAIYPKQYDYKGANDLAPIVIAGTALFVQARGSAVFGLGFDYQIDGYRGNELSIFASHLFEKYEIVDWDYQQIPNSNVWAVRDDGMLLGLTYVKEQEVIGWHWHETDGLFENVCSVPEGNEDALYVVVNRNGVRGVERFTTRQISDIKDAIFMDAALTYDGRSDGTVGYMTITGGTTWSSDETLTLEASSPFFSASDVGNVIQLVFDTGRIDFTIEAYTSSTIVTGKTSSDVPAFAQGIDTLSWTRAVNVVSGLWHLEGKDVSIIGDGSVVGSPNNEHYPVYTVQNGAVTLDRPYGVIHVGLPYTSDMETLDVTFPASTKILTTQKSKKRVSSVTVSVEESRGIFVGPNEDKLTELKIEQPLNQFDTPELLTGSSEIVIRPEWNSNGRILIRQLDPLPLHVLAVEADVDLEGR
jgi:hypothetical protein